MSSPTPCEGVASRVIRRRASTGRHGCVLGVLPTRPKASASNKVFGSEPPGNYISTVKGLTSGRTASAGLQVVTGAGTGTGPDAARLMLSKPQVAINDTYFATAWGFSSGEEVRFSWTGPTNGVMGVFSTDSAGSKSHGPVLEADPPGTYIITVTGLTSGRRATAELKVL